MQKKIPKRRTLLSPLLEQLYNTVKLSGEIENLGKKVISPTPVQVDFKYHKLAQNIFDTLHEEDGTRTDVNIWEFPTPDLAYSFVDTLTTLGIDEKNIIYPGSFLQFIEQDDEGNEDMSIPDQLTRLEQDLFGEEDNSSPDLSGELTPEEQELDQALSDLSLELDPNSDAGEENLTSDSESELDSALSNLESEIDIEDSEDLDNESETDNLDISLEELENELQSSGESTFDDSDEVDQSLSDLESELQSEEEPESLEIDQALSDLEVELQNPEEGDKDEESSLGDIDEELEELARELEQSNF